MMYLQDYERMPRGLGASLVDQLDLDASPIRVRKKMPANNGGGFGLRSTQRTKEPQRKEDDIITLVALGLLGLPSDPCDSTHDEIESVQLQDLNSKIIYRERTKTAPSVPFRSGDEMADALEQTVGEGAARIDVDGKEYQKRSSAVQHLLHTDGDEAERESLVAKQPRKAQPDDSNLPAQTENRHTAHALGPDDETRRPGAGAARDLDSARATSACANSICGEYRARRQLASRDRNTPCETVVPNLPQSKTLGSARAILLNNLRIADDGPRDRLKSHDTQGSHALDSFHSIDAVRCQGFSAVVQLAR
ncbi:hypothetical protein N7474_007223 [Penicillium riverlandense]|uniref:uncharacterized protein n=1 Tax=Penicillium riverlandense TaxID=1903569 RepID=UPI0025487D12|nr:uncharacterized protein N7474_007223 [Penicillium riverlandense]KAJ5815446.1 hypothetical protein N7474_007223 [Penicillium riverlandense]